MNSIPTFEEAGGASIGVNESDEICLYNGVDGREIYNSGQPLSEWAADEAKGQDDGRTAEEIRDAMLEGKMKDRAGELRDWIIEQAAEAEAEKSPSEIWELWVGGQAVQDFLELSPGMTTEQAVHDYLHGEDRCQFALGMPDEVLSVVERKLLAYIAEELRTMAKVQRKCTRCGYEWIQKGDAPPSNCASPKCRSPYWDVPRRKEKEK